MNESHPRKSAVVPPGYKRVYEPDTVAMLAAVRVVLGLPRVILNSSQDDLLSDAS